MRIGGRVSSNRAVKGKSGNNPSNLIGPSATTSTSRRTPMWPFDYVFGTPEPTPSLLPGGMVELATNAVLLVCGYLSFKVNAAHTASTAARLHVALLCACSAPCCL